MIMEPGNNQEGHHVWQDAETSELSPFTSVNLSLEVLPENDIMSIVMKRKVGGSGSEVIEDSLVGMPPKRFKRETFFPSGTEGEGSSIRKWSDHLSASKTHQPVVASSSDVTGTIEDTFSLSKFQCVNSKDFTQTDLVDTNAQEIIFKSTNVASDVTNRNDVMEDLPESQEKTYTNVIGCVDTPINLNELDFTLLKDKTVIPLDGSDSNNTVFSINESNSSNLTVLSGESDKTMGNQQSLQKQIRSESQCFIDNSRSQEVSIEVNRSVEEKSHECVHKCGANTQRESEVSNQDICVNKPNSAGCIDNNDVEDIENVVKNVTETKDMIAPQQEFLEELSNDNTDELTACDEVDSLNAYPLDTLQSKLDGKKSRKQHMPKRVPKMEPISTLKTSQKINPLWKVIKTLKPEKSRKQNIPKRVVKESDTNGSDIECYYDNESDSHANIDDEDDDNVDTFANSQQENSLNSSNYTKQSEENSMSDVETDNNSFTKQAAETDLMSNVTSGFNYNFPNNLPLHFQTAMMSYNSKKMFQSPVSSDLALEKLLEHNKADLTENLEVVKKLREIRYNRYRKISVTEKKEIAKFAKANGVSSAASHFGVSKSAVSMWTRIDFNDIDEDKETRKKNCMMGNQTFIELLIRVRSEKNNKFKGLSREDKFEVSRYAKLIGVREMARRLDIALGTVSGWMRQFPYMIKPANQEELSGQDHSDANEKQEDACINADESKPWSVKTKKVKQFLQDESEVNKTSKEHCTSVSESKLGPCATKEVSHSDKTEKQRKKHSLGKINIEKTEDQNSMTSLIMNIKTETDIDNEYVTKHLSKTDVAVDQSSSEGVKTKHLKEKGGSEAVPDNEPVKNSDEIDTMIAETYETPDVDQCFEDAKLFLQGTFLENDTFFERLFKRVVECRADKYKALKASEKLEVVRYAKRVGVRRIAKILGLATGTLSGWTTKYQGHLALTSDGVMDLNLSNASCMSDLDSSLDTSQNVVRTNDNDPLNESQNSQLNTSQYMVSPASSLLDEKAEVTAVKLILKDRFEVLRDKIGIARTIKFRNITQDEKIEVVKCTKLAGIRPTARVLNMPIGTLSGWITKYTSNLHPVYQEECDRLGGPSVHRPSQSAHTSVPGNQSYMYNIMNSQWPGIHHLSSLYRDPVGESLMENSQPGTNLSNLFGKSPMDFMSENGKQGTNLSTTHLEPSATGSMFTQFAGSVPDSMLQNSSYSSNVFNATVKSEPVDKSSESFNDESHSKNAEVSGVNDNLSKGFEEEAKTIAADYLQSVYKKFGLA